MIQIKTSDGKIFSRDQVIIDIIHAVQMGVNPIRLDLAGEGPCCQAIGLYALLDNICARFNYPRGQIEIVTANFLESHPDYQITRVHQNYELATTKRYPAVDSTKQFDNEFKHFGHFIGHSNRYRLQLASYLYANHREQTLQSYHCNIREPYHREFIGLEDLMFASTTAEEIVWAEQLIADSPITVDIPACQETINMSQNLNITQVYPTFFVELVSLTFFSGTTFYVDEKLWRPILMRTPFMVQGPAGLIENFKRLGFQTFDRYWNEGYSNDPDNCQVPAIIDNIKQLSKLSVWELSSLYQDMQPVLEHNYNRLMELTSKDFDQTYE